MVLEDLVQGLLNGDVLSPIKLRVRLGPRGWSWARGRRPGSRRQEAQEPVHGPIHAEDEGSGNTQERVSLG